MAGTSNIVPTLISFGIFSFLCKAFLISTFKVFFASLTDEEIVYYVDNYKPFDKAGAYGIQEWIGYVAVTRIEGSYFNVMGLPIQRLYTELKQFV